MLERTTLRRFTRWGLARGPAWGAVAVMLSEALPPQWLDFSASPFQLLAVGVGTGLLAGPALGIVVGLCCLAAERVPRWILDAPDYVAVLAVVAAVALVAWPTFQVLGGSPAAEGFGVALLAVTPAVDAARNAPALLRPAASPDQQPPPGSRHLPSPARVAAWRETAVRPVGQVLLMRIGTVSADGADGGPSSSSPT